MKIEIERDVVEQALDALEEPDGLDDYNRSISDLAITALREALSAPQPVQQEALTDEQKRAKWISATIEQCTHENCYYRGIADAETHHQNHGREIIMTVQQNVLDYVVGCFEAAIAEGLFYALAETSDNHLKDLLERRIMYAYFAAQEANERKVE